MRTIVAGLVLLLALAASAAERPGWFGLSFSFHGTFLRLCAVAPNGPAAAAGLQRDDLITQIGGKPVAFKDAKAALRFFATVKPNERVRLRVARGGRTFDVVVATAQRR